MTPASRAAWAPLHGFQGPADSVGLPPVGEELAGGLLLDLGGRRWSARRPMACSSAASPRPVFGAELHHGEGCGRSLPLWGRQAVAGQVPPCSPPGWCPPGPGPGSAGPGPGGSGAGCRRTPSAGGRPGPWPGGAVHPPGAQWGRRCPAGRRCPPGGRAAGQLHLDLDGVPGGAGEVGDDGPLIPRQGVEGGRTCPRWAGR